jgi:hypothetical protein
MREGIWMKSPNFPADNLKSKIQNRKLVGLSVNRFCVDGDWGCGAGAAAK